MLQCRYNSAAYLAYLSSTGSFFKQEEKERKVS